MNSKHDLMTALTAAKPEAFEPAAHPDQAVRDRDLREALARPRDGGARPVRRSRFAAPSRRAWAAAVAAALAAAAAFATALPLGGEADRPPAPATAGTGAGEPTDARRFLLAAAAQVERLPARTGAWWYEEQRTSEVHTFGVGGKTGPGPAYTVEVSQVTKSWSSRSRSWAVTTVEEPRFPSSRDRAAWRTAGSPSLLPGAPPDTTPPKPSVNDSHVPPSFLVGGESLTIDQLQRLPSHPDRLAARLRAGVQEQLEIIAGKPGTTGPSAEALLFHAAADLLNLPVTPEVRAAAFEVMAGVDGARLLGRVEDPAGRRGTGVGFPESPGAQRVFIVDEATATLMATELVANDPARFEVRAPAGSTILSITWLEIGWTDRLGRQP